MHLTYHIRMPRDAIGNKSRESTDILHIDGVERVRIPPMQCNPARRQSIQGYQSHHRTIRTSLCCRQRLERKAQRWTRS